MQQVCFAVPAQTPSGEYTRSCLHRLMQPISLREMGEKTGEKAQGWLISLNNKCLYGKHSVNF
jgi:hypothetical protein